MRIIAPFAPGGNADTLARVIGQKLSERFGQQFYIENIAGNGGVLGSAAAQRSEPDGYTFVVSGLASHVIAPAFNTNVKYDPIADFTHVAMLGGSPIVAVTNPAIGIKTLQELVDYARKTTPPPPYSSSGIGSHAHLTAEYFQHLAGVKLTHVAYRGGGQAMADLIGNHLSIGFNSLVATGQHIRAGTLVALGMTAPERLDNFPGLPTFAELGYPQLSGTTWFSISGPKGVPDAIAQKLNAELAVLLKQPDVIGKNEGRRAHPHRHGCADAPRLLPFRDQALGSDRQGGGPQGGIAPRSLGYRTTPEMQHGLCRGGSTRVLEIAARRRADIAGPHIVQARQRLSPSHAALQVAPAASGLTSVEP